MQRGMGSAGYANRYDEKPSLVVASYEKFQPKSRLLGPIVLILES